MPIAPRIRWIDPGLACLCAVIGMVLAVAPHLAMLAAHGSLLYLGDGDDVFYTVISRAPYRGEHGLSDPFQPARSPRQTLYPPLPFVPLAKLTRLLGIDRLLMPLVWRVVGGFLLGATLYTVFRVLLSGTHHPRGWALGCALIALADAGFVGGQTLWGAAGLLRAMTRGTTPMSVPNALGQFRVVTPLVSLPLLLTLAALIVPPLQPRSRTWHEIVAGMVFLGLCVHVYFFFWTAAVVALVLSLARAVVTKVYTERDFLLLVLMGGMVLGSPQVVTNARAFSDPTLKPILERTNRGRVLEPGDPLRTRYLWNVWAYAKLTFGAFVVFGFRFRRLFPIWAFTAAGFALTNSATLTGLEFENFHWVYVHAPFGEILLLSGSVFLIDNSRFQNIGLKWLGIVPVFVVLLASIWRPYEALRNSEARLYTGTLRDLLPLRSELAKLGPNDIVAGRWPSVNVALLLTDSGQLYQYDQTMYSTLAPIEEVYERKALNAWMNGLSMREYRDEIQREETPTSVQLLKARETLYDDLLSGETAARFLERYRPTHLIRPVADGPPPVDRGGPWDRAGSRGGWALWARR